MWDEKPIVAIDCPDCDSGFSAELTCDGFVVFERDLPRQPRVRQVKKWTAETEASSD